MSKKCLKCGHIAEGEPTACPACGAIYAKVEAAFAKVNADLAMSAELGAEVPQRNVGLTRGRRAMDGMSRDQYVDVLRQETLYPTTRSLTNIIHWFFIVVAVGVLIGGGLVGFKAGAGAVIGALLLAGGIYLVSRLMTEMTVMIIDLCDSNVRTAYHTERGRQQS